MTSHLNERDAVKARRRPAARTRPDPNQSSEFINRELSLEETAAYRIWREDFETVTDLWTELLEAGYRVNTKYDDYSSSCATFIIPVDGEVNSGYILTGRGGTAYRAVSEAIYKHSVLFSGEWVPTRAGRAGSEDPDF